MRKLFGAGAAIAFLSVAGVAAAATFPGFGLDTAGPALLITLNSGATATITSTGQPATYDGSDDTYIGVINNSGHTVNSINISSTADIFGFDGDGIDTYGAASNSTDTTGYGGPSAYFTNLMTAGGTESGTVNFIGGISNGGSNYFSLEEALDAASFTGPITTGGVPEPGSWALMLIGMAGVGASLRMARRRNALSATVC
jgi:hypothetical protein